MRRLLAVALIALPSFGYITQTLTTGGQTYTVRRYDNTSISYLLNSKVRAGMQSTVTGQTLITTGSNPTTAAQSAFDSWNATGADVHFNTLQTTDLTHDASDCKNVILVASSANDLAAVGGALAVTATAYSVAGPVCNGSTNATPGTIYDADIIFAPAPASPFSTDNTANSIDFQSVLTHELGHSLGSNHSGLVGSTMFWSTYANQLNQRILTTDDASFATSVYPAAGANPGKLSGKISAGDGSPIKFAMITAIDRTAGGTYGGLTAADGTYSINVPAGSYIVYAEPFNGFVSPQNIYFGTGVLDVAQVSTGFLPTFLGTSGNPTATPVAAGQTATANITVTGGTSSLTAGFLTLAAAGGSGGITSLPGLGPAVTLTSGKSVDIAIGGGGIDTSTTFLIFGRGISVKAGSTHSEGTLSNGATLMRFTVDIPAQTDTTIASLWIVKGNNILAFSGGLVITPKTPTFTSNGFVNAASYGGNGTVSPGGLSSLYDTTNLSIGPATPVINTTYDVTGKLATSAGGVTLTFNGVAAPIYFSYAGQINFQVPFELAGLGTAQAVVTYNGVSSAPVTVNVVQTQPTFFTATPQKKDALIHNYPSYTLNNAGNAAERGSIVILYGTGIGKLSYDLATGQPGIVPPSSYQSTFTCTFGGQTTTAYGYWNYGFVGEATWTVTVPPNTPTGAVDLTCQDNAGGTTPAVTIYIK